MNAQQKLAIKALEQMRGDNDYRLMSRYNCKTIHEVINHLQGRHSPLAVHDLAYAIRLRDKRVEIDRAIEYVTGSR